MLSILQPRAKVQLSGPSLVVKYSHKNPNLLITADSLGSVYVVDCLDVFNYKMEKFPNVTQMDPKSKLNFNFKNLDCIRAHDYPIFDIDWHDNSTKFITGGADPACMVWDIEKSKCLSKAFSHTRTVRCVKSCQSNPSKISLLFLFQTFSQVVEEMDSYFFMTLGSVKAQGLIQ